MTRKHLWLIILTLTASAWSLILFQLTLSDESHLLKLAIRREIKERIFPYNWRNKRIRSEEKIRNPLLNGQHLFTNKTSSIRWKSNEKGGKAAKWTTFRADSFENDWCRIQKARLDWQAYLGPCANRTKWKTTTRPIWGIEERTDASRSEIVHWDIRPAGEFTKFFMKTKTSSNHLKTIGGDSWRVRVTGTASISPTVFDHRNGTYEILFLAMEPGTYSIRIFLDYSLCDGLRDPPVDWYKQGTV